jgi:hypothetical protein
MIDFPCILGPDGRPLVRQTLTHPAVFLDTWALRLFAEDDRELGRRFRDALVTARGTLVLSHLSLGEFTVFADVRHADAAGTYVDTIFPNIFFSRFDPFAVMKAEIPIMVGQRKGSPAGDDDVLRLFAEDAQRAGYPSIRYWFLHMHSARAELASELRALAGEFLKGFEALRTRFRTEPGFSKSALRDIRQSTRPRATQALLRALLYRLRTDPNLKITANDAIDILHAIVAAAYCDLVLLDGPCHRRLTDTERFLRRSGITTKIALFYTQRNDGVPNFLEKLEAWPTKLFAA